MSEIYNKGLSDQEVLQSREKHGPNLLTPPPDTPWWKLYFEKFKDPIIIILLVATAVTLAIGIKEGDFTESIGIIIAILLATGVGFWQEYSAKKKLKNSGKKMIPSARVWSAAKTAQPILSMTDRQPLTVNRTSDMYLHVLSRI